MVNGIDDDDDDTATDFYWELRIGKWREQRMEIDGKNETIFCLNLKVFFQLFKQHCPFSCPLSNSLSTFAKTTPKYIG